MVDNSKPVLENVLQQLQETNAPTLSASEYFQIFCSEQILKDYNLSDDEIQAGIVDGGNDGGIDCIYAFANGELLFEDYETSHLKKNIEIELHIIQAKTSGGFGETPIDKLYASTKNMLNLSNSLANMSQYDIRVKTAIDTFRTTYNNLASKFPTLKIHYHYAVKTADAEYHTNLDTKSEELIQLAKELFSEAEVNFNFLGSKVLLELARRRPKTSHDLRTSKSLSAENGYIVLSQLTDFNKFLRSEEDKVKLELFESNVRDYQNSNQVNRDIENTLKNEKEVDFWWMNNGITIIASRASQNGDIITIENPQIVNGLQTSTQITKHFEIHPYNENRNVMIKIVSSEKEETRDKIIKATNSQSTVQPSSLRATDKIQRDIEESLKRYGYFYDRRKNFYKNSGKPSNKIISISLMAQAAMSTLLGRPDSARARPSTIIKDDKVYSQLFSESHPIELYTNIGILIKRIESTLKARADMSSADRNNIRFYVLYFMIIEQTQKTPPKPHHVKNMDINEISGANLESSIDQVWNLFKEHGATDQIAKGPDFKKHVERVATVMSLF